MNDRDKTLRDDVTFWPRERRRSATSAPPNRVERRGVSTLRPGKTGRAAQQDDLDLVFSLEGGLAASPSRGYNPYDSKPRRDDVLPWSTRRR